MKSNIVEVPAFTETDVIWIDADASAPVSAPGVLLTIREVAEQFSVTPRALRFYESKGLLSPTRDRGTRVYGEADQRHLALILKGQRLGFTLAEIAQMIDARNGRASSQALRLTRQKCLDQIAMFERRIDEAREAVAELRRIHTSLCCQ
jgi:DNA-binding transcriptional MerR regulator